ncbi:lipoprotein-releasing ABC transporter ATP-binding protein LolD [soil metagenome]
MNNTTQSPVLMCQGLAKVFAEDSIHTQVLKNVNLAVRAGERIAIVGSSGAGKSTLLQLLGGLEQPSAGVVEIMGKNIHQLSELERCRLRNETLGFVYQFHHLLPEFTVLENVCIPLLIRGMPPKQAQAKALVLLEKVGLIPRQRHKLGELSGGERQRTAIARALVSDPVCLFADEPTGNLDQYTAERVYLTMLELNQQFNTSFIIVTHDMHLASYMDRVLTLADGVLKDA